MSVTSPLVEDRPATAPLSAIFGVDSQIRDQKFLRIRDVNSWQQLQRRYLGTAYDPYYGEGVDVDFERCEVVAIFGDESIFKPRVHLESFHQSDSTILIRFDFGGGQIITGLSTNLGQPTSQPAEATSSTWPKTAPFAFLILPKSARSVILEEDHRSLRSDPPKWVEVARLQAK